MLPVQGALRGTFVVRPLSAAAAESSQQQQPRADGKQARARAADKDALAVDEAQFDAITDQIPQRPMGVVEGTSYTLLILAGVAVAGAQWGLACTLRCSRQRGTLKGKAHHAGHPGWQCTSGCSRRRHIGRLCLQCLRFPSCHGHGSVTLPKACILMSHWHALHSAT